MTTSEILMICLTTVIATAGVIGAVIFNNQLSVMQDQLDEMKTAGEYTKIAANAAQQAAKVAADSLIASQRPWIKANIIFREKDPPHWQNDGSLGLVVGIVVSNVGHSTAEKIRIGVQLLPESPIDFEGPIPEQVELCNRINDGPPIELSLFEGDSEIQWRGVSTRHPSGGGPIGPNADDVGMTVTLIGCVDYQFAFSPRHHKTRFAYTIDRFDRVKNMRWPMKIGEPLSTTDIRMDKWAFGGNNAD